MADSPGNQVMIPGLVEVGHTFDVQGHLTGNHDPPLIAVGMVRHADTFFEHEKDHLLLVVLKAIALDSGDRNFDLGQR